MEQNSRNGGENIKKPYLPPVQEVIVLSGGEKEIFQQYPSHNPSTAPGWQVNIVNPLTEQE